MAADVLIVKNISREGSGLLGGLLDSHSISYQVADLDAGDTFPSPVDFKAVVVLGGPDSANDATEKMQNELVRIREAVDAGVPYLGICLGLQTLVKAMGGSVVKNPVREIGFRDPEGNLFTVELTEAGKHDPLFAGMGESFGVFHLHGETVELAAGMELLGEGAFCRNQIVRVGENAYGIQCHFELTDQMFNTWLAEDPDLKQSDEEQLRSDFAQVKAPYTEIGLKLFTNFLRIAGFKSV